MGLVGAPGREGKSVRETDGTVRRNFSPGRGRGAEVVERWTQLREAIVGWRKKKNPAADDVDDEGRSGPASLELASLPLTSSGLCTIQLTKGRREGKDRDRPTPLRRFDVEDPLLEPTSSSSRGRRRHAPPTKALNTLLSSLRRRVYPLFLLALSVTVITLLLWPPKKSEKWRAKLRPAYLSTKEGRRKEVLRLAEMVGEEPQYLGMER